MDLFGEGKQESMKEEPLAHRCRPERVDQIVGQDHIVGEGTYLRGLLSQSKIPSMILYGPPGVGKTTLARAVSRSCNRPFYSLNATMDGVGRVREVVAASQEHISLGHHSPVLFIDEIHRFSRAQQDSLLPYVEDGTIVLIGATTENPMFALTGPILSRCRLVELQPLSEPDLRILIQRGISLLNSQSEGTGKYLLTTEGEDAIIRQSSGDGRVALNLLESAAALALPEENADGSPSLLIGIETVMKAASKRQVAHDRSGDWHYDVASAFIKSIRGSDADAAIYWLARMVYAGEDPRFIARRLVILASEDVGMADPFALVMAESAFDAVSKVGMPEARIILAHTTVYLALAEKSNSAYLALERALSEMEKGRADRVPLHLKDASYKGAERLGRGGDYLYPHDYPGHYVKQ